MKIRKGFVSNSSSSSFICDNKSNLTIEQVKKILVNIFELATDAETIKTEDNKHRGFPNRFEDMFQEPFIIKDLTEKYVEYEDVINYIDMIWNWKRAYKNDFNDPFKYAGIKNKKDFIGKLIINSTSDNTIPYEFFDFIKNTFDGERVHLG